jgi:hypothetical protein
MHAAATKPQLSRLRYCAGFVKQSWIRRQVASSYLTFEEKQTLSPPAVEGTRLFWITVLCLMPTFLQRIASSGQGDTYGQIDGVSLAPLGYVGNVGVIFACLFVLRASLSIKETAALVLLFFFGLAQIAMTQNEYGIGSIELFFTYIRAIIWLFCAFIFARTAFNTQIFADVFIKLTTFFFLIVIGSAAIFYTTGVPFGTVIGQGVVRSHGLFSEPSVLGSIAPAFIVISFRKRSYVQLLIGVLALFFSNSTTAYTTLLLVILVEAFSRFPKTQSILLGLIVGTFILFLFALNFSNSFIISDFARYLSQQADFFLGNSTFKRFTVDRLLNSLIDLPNFLSAGENDYSQDIGNLARLGGPRVMINHMANDGFYWSGYGLSIFAIISLESYRSVLDFGILPYFIGSFGVILGVTAIIFFTWRIDRWKYTDPTMFTIFTSALLGTMLNSAGGLSLYILVLIGGFAVRQDLSIRDSK